MAFAVKNHVLHRDDKTVAQAPTPNVGGALKPYAARHASP